MGESRGKWSVVKLLIDLSGMTPEANLNQEKKKGGPYRTISAGFGLLETQGGRRSYGQDGQLSRKAWQKSTEQKKKNDRYLEKKRR